MQNGPARNKTAPSAPRRPDTRETSKVLTPEEAHNARFTFGDGERETFPASDVPTDEELDAIFAGMAAEEAKAATA
jgi:hypothetical protein